MMTKARFWLLLVPVALLAAVPCRGEERVYLMGSTPFFATVGAFPDWRFEDLGDKDFIALHVDDFWGVPWEAFAAGAAPPPAWSAKWQALAASAGAGGKIIYLSVSPLAGRKTLAAEVGADGQAVNGWAPVDGSGCFDFAADSQFARRQTAYVNYSKFVIDLVRPRFFSPAIEMNVAFSLCPSQREAWTRWYAGVHLALKQAYPALIIFPTFQMEHLYGVADAASSCGAGVSDEACFDKHLDEALLVPADRAAFSVYPVAWVFKGESMPVDTFAKIQARTSSPIWVSETGWPSVRIPVQSTPSCGADAYPASIANETKQAAHMDWLLGEAQARRMEAIVWWLNRDFLDGPSATVCPCSGDAGTCDLINGFASAGAGAELLLRLFANMGLRRFDGAARPAHALWSAALARPHVARAVVPARQRNLPLQAGRVLDRGNTPTSPYSAEIWNSPQSARKSRKEMRQ